MRSTTFRLLGVVVLSGACAAPAATVGPTHLATPFPTVAVTAPPTTPVASPTAAASGGQRLRTVAGPPEPLEAGTYLTPEGFEPALSITVPGGWFGAATRSDFSVGQGLNEAEERYEDSALYLGPIGLDYDAAVAAFAALQGVEFTEPSSSTTLDGHQATVFYANPIGDQVVLADISPGADLTYAADRQILVDVDGGTVLIRTELFDPVAEPVLTEVIESIRFP